MKLSCQTYGTHGPVLVILHGLLGSSDNLHSVAKDLSPHLRILVPDARNHGRSPHDPMFTYQAMVEDIRELLGDKGMERASILGHSMGGKTAMMLALDSPELVESLMVVDIAPKPMKPGHDEIFDAMRSVDLATVKFRKDVDAALVARIPNWATRQFILKNLKANENGGYEWKLNLDAVFQSYEEVNREIDAARPYAGPALFLRGARSRYILDEDITKIQELFPRAKVSTIPDAGHWVHVDNPKAFMNTIREFLAIPS